ncbi:MAG: hypothetical protein K2H98_00720 [Duncaniella sp.]|nr:hypothetical protein [Duncaniella sp.]
MKRSGSILEFTHDRNRDLMRVFRSIVRDLPSINMRQVATRLVAMPSVRFWVSQERATAVVSAMLAGRPLPANTRSSKRLMYSEIYRRVLALRELRPDDDLADLVTEVVHSPAPCFYMLPRSAMDIIYKIQNGYYRRIPQYHHLAIAR